MTGCAAISSALPNFRNGKGTCLLTPRGGFFDIRNQNRDLEPSAKTFHDSDRRTSPNSRGMDVLPTNVLQQILPMLRTHPLGFPNFGGKIFRPICSMGEGAPRPPALGESARKKTPSCNCAIGISGPGGTVRGHRRILDSGGGDSQTNATFGQT